MNLEIIKIASDTKNYKKLSKFTHKAKSKNSLCGDEIEITLKLKDNRIKDIGYFGKFCVYCQASACLSVKNLLNKNIKELDSFFIEIKNFYDGKEYKLDKEWRDLKKIINPKNLKRKECIYLPINSIKKALKIK